jgi:branched-chain amino acid transport system ATP-binding protein
VRDGARADGGAAPADGGRDEPRARAGIRKAGVTVLLVEQDVFAALRVADRGYVLETGAVVREGPAAALANDPDVRRAYLGL